MTGWEIIIRSTAETRSKYSIQESITNIGRESSNEIVLRGDGVSRIHAQLEFNQGNNTLIVRDLDSTNGIFVNHQQLDGERFLQTGDLIRIGTFLLTAVNLSRISSKADSIINLDKIKSSEEFLIRSIDQYAILFHELSSQLAVIQTLEDSLRIISSFLKNMLGVENCGIILPEECEEFIQNFGFENSVNHVIENQLSLIVSSDEQDAVGKSLSLSPAVVDGEFVALLYAYSDDVSSKTFEESDLQLMVGASHHTALVFQRNKYEKLILYHANYDGLTGLPNRNLLLARLNQAIAEIKRERNYGFALLFMDIDNFKLINDSLGHDVGDQLLQAISNMLVSSFRETDLVTRLGGDEFVIFYDQVNDINEILPVINRIIENTKKPFVLAGRKLVITISVGIVMSSMEYENAEDIIRDADIAMYKSKQSEDESFRIYDKHMHAELMDLLHLHIELREAHEQDEFLLHYQPIINLKTGRIDGLEALIRWNSSKHGLYIPDQFFPSLNTTGLLSMIENWVMATACEQVSILNKYLDSDSPLYISINFSQKQLKHPSLIDDIYQVITKNDMNPGQLIIEITEKTSMADGSPTIAILETIKSMGVQLWLDDFGTGYSSLSYLHRLPINTLKIDKTFISQIGIDREKSKITRAILALSKSLGLRVVAEGVETKEQFDFLRSVECDYAQGHYFSKAVQFEEILNIVKNEGQHYYKPLFLRK